MGHKDKYRAPKLMPLEKRLMLDASLPAIAGQVLWLDAADASTIRDADGDNAGTGTGGANNGFAGTVATWVDKSGSGFNVTQSTAANRPTYTVGALNGQNVITFDGTNDKLTNTGATIAGNDYTMFIVFDRSIAGGRDGVVELGNGGSRNALFVNDSANKLGFYANGAFFNSTNVYTPGTYEVVTMMHDVTALSLWRNNVQEVNATATTRTSTTGIYVGDDSSGSDELNGHIAEIIVYDRDLTADERRDVQNYLAGKWGRTITGNAAPVLATNTGDTLLQGTNTTITGAKLAATDADNSESILRYTITDLADYGTISNTNTSHTYILGESFTQADIDAGYIRYTHNNTTNFTDSFSFTVSDGYATTAASTFNFSITPSNAAPVIGGWTLVSSEDFQSGATGWNDNTTYAGGGLLTTFLGRHSQDGGVQSTFKTYTLSGTQNTAVIEFDMYKLDTWDGEFFRVFINDTQSVNISLQQGTFATPANGSAGIVSYTVQEMTPFLANLGSAGGNDQIFRFTLTISNSAAANVKLGFSSTLDQAVGDESWGVDNINIYEVRPGGTPGPIGIIENSAIGTVVGQISATDADVADVITYSIVGGTGASVFSINSTTGVITVNGALNYEATTSYTLDIRATDNGTGNLYDSETITINVLNLPENTAPTVNALGPISIAENTANGTVIGTITGSDPESNTLTWSITAGNTDNIFAINAATGAIRVNSNTNLNAEWDNSYTLTIRAQDNGFGNLTATRNVTVNITSVNEAPTFDIPQSFLNANPYLRYNAATGNFYMYVGTTANYTAASAAAAANMLNGVAGHLATITSAAENAYVRALGAGNLWLGASDAVTEGDWLWAGSGPEGGSLFSQGSVAQGGYYTNWVTGQPDNSSNEDHLEMQASGQWNDALTSVAKAYVIEWEGSAVMAALGNGPFTLAENPALNQSVGFVHARDVDAGDTLSYSITGGTGSAHFAVNATTGEITVTNPSAINYEAATSYTLDLRVQDIGGLFHTRTVTINITDVNEAPVLNAAGPVSIAEDIALNTVIVDMDATDVDGGQTLTYSITAGNGLGIFTINSSNGQIRIANRDNLNYETGSVYNLTIRATDNGTGALFDSEVVTINITDVNEGPRFDPIQRLLDADPGLRYNSVTGNFYRYIPTGLNFADATAAANARMLNGVGGYLTNIGDLAENNFVRGMISNTAYIGGTDSVVEGEWRWLGGDNAGDMFWLGTSGGSVQNGLYNSWNGGEPNQSGNEDALELRTNGGWNDINGATVQGYVVEWSGADVLASITNGPYTLGEHAAIGFTPGDAHAGDPDTGDTLVYSITGGTGAGVFNINGATGEITLATGVNYEVQNSYTLDLRVEDSQGAFDTLSITVTITDQNDVPGTLSLAGNHIVENSSIGTLIGSLSTVDEDPADTHTYSLVTNPGGKFTIVNGNEIRTLADIDYEQNQSFSIVLRTSDGNGGILDRTFLITVGDVMDTFTPPPASGGPSGAESYIPPEEEKQERSVDLLRSSLGSEQGAFGAFYGDYRQIVRENVTFEIMNLLGGIGSSVSTGVENVLVVDSAQGYDGLDGMKEEEGAPQKHYTNLREAILFLQQMADTQDKDGADRDAQDNGAAQRDLPANTIDRQFVDVLTYHKERAARLREALLETA